MDRAGDERAEQEQKQEQEQEQKQEQEQEQEQKQEQEQLVRKLAFVQESGFTRMWPVVLKKFVSYGVAGEIRLTRLNQSEQELFAELFAINMFGQAGIRFTMQELDHALMETRLKLTVIESLRLLFGDQAMRREEHLEVERESWEQFCAWAGAYVQTAESHLWLSWLQKGKALGYRTFLECYEQYRELGTSVEWIHAIRSLDLLPVLLERLPIFAAKVTGDAHGLDRDRLAGRMFYWGIVARLDPAGGELRNMLVVEDEVTKGAGTEEIRMQYNRMGIILDDISSNVMVAGWGVYLMLPVSLPLFTIERLTPPLPQIKKLYVVENPSIFGALIDHWAIQGLPAPYPIICTSGQPSLAAIRLMDSAVKGDATLYYSGDYDVKGVEMATLLHKRYRNKFKPWGMDAITYDQAQQPNLLVLSEKEKDLLARMQLGWEEHLIAVMLGRGKKVFQEHIVDQLIGDWQRNEHDKL